MIDNGGLGAFSLFVWLICILSGQLIPAAWHPFGMVNNQALDQSSRLYHQMVKIFAKCSDRFSPHALLCANYFLGDRVKGDFDFQRPKTRSSIRWVLVASLRNNILCDSAIRSRMLYKQFVLVLGWSQLYIECARSTIASDPRFRQSSCCVLVELMYTFLSSLRLEWQIFCIRVPFNKRGSSSWWRSDLYTNCTYLRIPTTVGMKESG